MSNALHFLPWGPSAVVAGPVADIETLVARGGSVDVVKRDGSTRTVWIGARILKRDGSDRWTFNGADHAAFRPIWKDPVATAATKAPKATTKAPTVHTSPAVTAGPSPDVIAATVAALVAAGASPDVIAATVAALEGPKAPKAPKAPAPITHTVVIDTAATAAAATHDDACDSCGSTIDGPLATHRGALRKGEDLKVCTACKAVDAATVIARASKRDAEMVRSGA